ncbi:hypothetical protein O9X90_25765 [Agrobacterium leguminum]|uniref:hypothetical protein n=1 Tax=Agrobacterium leguminum TaxID=2792015 RepID=UPI0022B83616|nr:hypothetical protein [Agrobacterium leguminum]MCZ7935739.1 hypothetical protein [Agrobacterium leguminum]
MNHLIGFTLRVMGKLLDLYLKILMAILSFLGRALVRIVVDIYLRLTHKPMRRAPTRRTSYPRRRGHPRRR